MRRLALASLFLLPAAATSTRAAPPLPSIVEARVKQDVKDCDTHDAKFEKGFITRRDINGDGKEDYILDYGRFSCGGSHNFCGSGGCATVIYASRGSGYAMVMDDLVRGIQFKTIGGRPAMLLGLHGSACGKMGAAACGATLYWNGEKFSPAH